MSNHLTPEELIAIKAFAKAHGRRWKRTLAEDYWYNARLWDQPHGSILHGLRNRLGPMWLDSFRLPKEPTT